MAGESYLFTRNYAYDPTSAASTPGTSVSTNTPDKAIDKDRETYWETADATPQLKIDLQSARAIDSLWFYADNVATFRLYYSTDDISYSPAFADTADAGENGYNHVVNFTEQTARYWRLDITSEVSAGTNTKIYEVFLSQLVVEFADGEALGEVEQNRIDIGGGSYLLADGTAVGYKGLSNEWKESLTLEFKDIDKTTVNSVVAFFEANSIFCYAIYFDLYPERIFQAVLAERVFSFNFSNPAYTEWWAGRVSIRQA